MARLLFAFLIVAAAVSRCFADDGASTLVGTPVVLVRVAGVDRALDMADRLLTAGGAPQYTQFVRGFLIGLNDLRGIDRSRPLGGCLFLDESQPEAEPVPLVFVPVTNLDDLRATLAMTGNSLAPGAAADEYQLRLGQDQLLLRLVGDVACIGPTNRPRPSLEFLKTVLAAKPETAPADLSVEFFAAGVPLAARHTALAAMRAEFDRELARRDGEPDVEYGLRSELQRRVFGGFERIVTDSERLTLELRLDAETTAIHLEAEYRVAAASELGPRMATALQSPTELAQSGRTSAALGWDLQLRLDESDRDLAGRCLAFVQEQFQREAGSELPEPARRAGARLFDALAATIDAGRRDLAIQFHPTPSGEFLLLLALGLEQTDAVDTAFREVFPYLQEADEITSAALDVDRIRDVAVHRVVGHELRPREERLYGTDAALYLGAGEGALWLMIGGDDALEVVEAEIGATDGAVGASDSPASATAEAWPVSSHFRLRPWLAFAARQSPQPNQRFLDLAEQVLSDPSLSDRIDWGVAATGQGLALRAEIGDGLVTLAAKVLVQAARPE
jgi:hypothetical protein